MKNNEVFDFPEFNNLTIKEIKKYCSELKVNKKMKNLISILNQDSRKGVKKIAARLQRKIEKDKAVKDKWQKMNKIEAEFYSQGYQAVIGIDEAGRGPLAGPVVASAVFLDPEQKIYGLDDSKKLSKKRREELFKEIKNKAKVGVGRSTSSEIDKYNIREATFVAMKRAVKDLLSKMKINPGLLLIDGNAVIPDLTIEQKSVVDGDSKANSIAAASIIAKVSRDNIIFKYAEQFPEYKFKNNKGYGTADHIEALEKYGASPIHRRSFGRVPE